MNSRIIIGAASALAIALVGIGVGSYFGSPYLAVGALSKAVKDGDRDKLEQLVDFPAVKDNLRSDINAQIVDKFQNDPEMKNNPFASLGLAMIPMMVDKVIDTNFTPAQIIRQRETSPLYMKSASPDQPKADPKMTYKGLDNFTVSYQTAQAMNLQLVFRRHGLFEWQLKRIEIPNNFFEQTDASPAQSSTGH